MAHPKRLISIGPSHYCEKARWALDRIHATYEETAYPPMLHVVPTRLAGGRSTPVLITPHHTFKDSTDILKFVDRVGPNELRLYPDDAAQRKEVEELEDYFDESLGPASRRWIYFYLLKNRALFIEAICAGATPRDRAIATKMVSLIERGLKLGLKIDEPGAQRSYAKLNEVFDRVDRTLADGRRYLVGDTFTAADLTLAALAAPAVLPAEYGVPLPDVRGLPGEALSAIDGFRRRPTGEMVLRLYREERRAAAHHD
ncbi:MAG: glutathione S-transferase C-terminal domain-containing protein [Polyangiaceae bacterium]